MATSGAADALSSLGGDLTFSVSWSVATELLDAARETQLGEAELIAIVLGFSVVLGALPTAMALARAEADKFWTLLDAYRRRVSRLSKAQAELKQRTGEGAVPERPAADGATTAARTAAGDAGTGDASTTGRDGALALNGTDPVQAGESSGIAAFLGLFVSIFQRISVSIVVQLLAANVRTQQPLRAVRVLTLLSVAVFFLFWRLQGRSDA